MNHYILWVDDIRSPKFFLKEIYGEDFLSQLQTEHKIVGKIPVMWARDAEQALHIVAEMGRPIYMCLDHDLGQPIYLGGETETIMSFLEDVKLLDGWDSPPSWRCHSANPVGKKNAESFLDSWSRTSDTASRVPLHDVSSDDGW